MSPAAHPATHRRQLHRRRRSVHSGASSGSARRHPRDAASWSAKLPRRSPSAPRCSNPEVVQYKWIIIALIIGAGIGIPLGMVHMTAVPQRTALSHAFGALSAAMIGIAEYYVGVPHVTRFGMGEIGLEVIIGSLTFTGSVIAAGKLQEILAAAPDRL